MSDLVSTDDSWHDVCQIIISDITTMNMSCAHIVMQYQGIYVHVQAKTPTGPLHLMMELTEWDEISTKLHHARMLGQKTKSKLSIVQTTDWWIIGSTTNWPSTMVDEWLTSYLNTPNDIAKLRADIHTIYVEEGFLHAYDQDRKIKPEEQICQNRMTHLMMTVLDMYRAMKTSGSYEGCLLEFERPMSELPHPARYRYWCTKRDTRIWQLYRYLKPLFSSKKDGPVANAVTSFLDQMIALVRDNII